MLAVCLKDSPSNSAQVVAAVEELAVCLGVHGSTFLLAECQVAWAAAKGSISVVQMRYSRISSVHRTRSKLVAMTMALAAGSILWAEACQEVCPEDFHQWEVCQACKE